MDLKSYTAFNGSGGLPQRTVTSRPVSCRLRAVRRTFPDMSHRNDDAIRDLLDRASWRKFEARHGDAEFRSDKEAEIRQAIREAGPAAWEFGP